MNLSVVETKARGLVIFDDVGVIPGVIEGLRGATIEEVEPTDVVVVERALRGLSGDGAGEHGGVFGFAVSETNKVSNLMGEAVSEVVLPGFASGAPVVVSAVDDDVSVNESARAAFEACERDGESVGVVGPVVVFPDDNVLVFLSFDIAMLSVIGIPTKCELEFSTVTVPGLKGVDDGLLSVIKRELFGASGVDMVGDDVGIPVNKDVIISRADFESVSAECGELDGSDEGERDREFMRY